MGNKNNKISSFQVAVIGVLIGNSLFEGIGSVFIIASTKQNSWVSAIVATIIGLIPLALILYIINYQPELDITKKINHLFGRILGNVINFILSACIFILLVTTLSAVTNFAEVKYLTETPPIIIGILFMTAAVYASIKGIEAIARSSEILIYISLFFHLFTKVSLVSYIELDNLLPFMEKGFMPILKGAVQFITYTISPFILLTIIPKSMVVDNKKLNKYFTYGYLSSMVMLVLALFVILTTIGPNLADLYRFPSYYVMKKIHLSGFLENLENILSTVWIINMYIAISMSTHYLSTYVNNIFKIKKDNYRVMGIFVIAILALYAQDKYFYSSVVGLNIANKFFPYLVGVPLFIIVTVVSTKIFYNKKLRKVQE